MCPGGRVIGCSARPGGVITNGMSRFRRDSPYANSAVVVNVRIEDLGCTIPLAGLDIPQALGGTGLSWPGVETTAHRCNG